MNPVEHGEVYVTGDGYNFIKNALIVERWILIWVIMKDL